jgi:hypothetical protein
LLLALACGVAWGQGVQRIEMTCGRTEIVADGQDVALVEVIVTDTLGNPIGDGTLVHFQVDIGTMEADTVGTVGGRAEGRYRVLSQSAEEVTIRASAGGKISEAPLRLKIVRDRADSERGQRFMEIRTSNYMAYFDSSALLVAYGDCRLSYRSLSIRADTLQFSVSDFVMKASDAEMSNGSETIHAKRLYVEFGRAQTRGVALIIDPEPKTLYFSNERFFEAEWPAPNDKFRDYDPGESDTVIKCDKAVIRPGEKMILTPAKIYYKDVHVFTLSARELSLGAALPDAPQYLGWGADGPIVDIPWYFLTKRNYTGRVRVRRGSPFGPVSGREGFYVDTEFELHSNSGDDAKVVVDGLLTNTYGASLRYARRVDDRTRVSAYLGWPQHSYVTGSANYWHNGSSSDNIVNARAYGGGSIATSFAVTSSWNFRPHDFVGDWRWQYSFDTELARDSYDPSVYAGAGLRVRLDPEKPYTMGSRVSLSPRISSGVSVDTLGRAEGEASGSMDLNLALARGTVLGFSYTADYREGGRLATGLTQRVTGRLNSFGSDRWWASASASYNLTNESFFGVAYGSWEVIPEWHVDAGVIFQQFGPASLNDYTIGLGRDIGEQQARIVYSTSEGRIYFEFRRKGAFFNF